MKSFTVRVDSNTSSYDDPDVVMVSFTGRPKPKKKKKKEKDGMCAPSFCGDFPDFRVPMTVEEASRFPIGHSCKITLEPTSSDEDDAMVEGETRSDRKNRMAKAYEEMEE